MEILKSGDRIRESVAPYSRFVRAEGENLQAVQSELGERDRSARGAAVPDRRLPSLLQRRLPQIDRPPV